DLMFNITGVIEIKDNNGQYEFIYDLPEKFKNVKVKYYDIEEVGTDTLRGKGEISAMPGKVITVQATFKGDTVTGFAKLGGMTAKIKNGKRIG
ncbi:MAG: hypothetical protein ACI4W6_02735, partial [Acutalibacteraceae bacterium]